MLIDRVLPLIGSLRNQVILITGASSGIGRETALAFGGAGASRGAGRAPARPSSRRSREQIRDAAGERWSARRRRRALRGARGDAPGTVAIRDGSTSW